jgi:hypothetical protein
MNKCFKQADFYVQPSVVRVCSGFSHRKVVHLILLYAVVDLCSLLYNICIQIHDYDYELEDN